MKYLFVRLKPAFASAKDAINFGSRRNIYCQHVAELPVMMLFRQTPADGVAGPTP
jgi:hypothetical protein